MSKKPVIEKSYNLSLKCIDEIAGEIEKAAKQFNMDKKDALRFRLSAEESLNIWYQKLGEGAPVRFEISSKLGRPIINIIVAGERLNPYDIGDQELGSSKNMLVSVGLIPVYSYQKNENILSFVAKKKSMNQFAVLALVIVSAAAVGILGKMLIPDNIVGFICDDIMTPIEDTMFNVLSCIAGPMIFLSVAWGIYGIGDVYTLGRVGKKMMVSFLSVVFLFCLGGVFFYPLLGPAMTGVSAHNSQFKAFLQMILGIFPSNIFSPFVDGNTLQIIILALVVGVALIFLGQRTHAVAMAVEQINHIINFIMNFISKFVPYFVFIVLVQLIWSGELTAFKSIWKLALIFLAAYVCLILILLVYTSIKNKISFIYLLKSCFPTYIIALTTASSAAAFDSNMTISKKKLGVSDSLASFGVPFGMVMFKPNTALYYILFCFYASSVYKVDVSVNWLIIAVIVITVSAVATPPIPGGSTATYTILFLQLGIPAEALAIALSVDMLFDFLMTSGDMFSLLIEIFNISNKIGMCDKNIIKKEQEKHKKKCA